MSNLATQAELVKLSSMMDVPLSQLNFLKAVPAESLRFFRLALVELHFEQKRNAYRWLGMWVYMLPSWVVALCVRWWISPALTAKIACSLSAWRMSKIAGHLPDEFMAKVAAAFDPRAARELILLLPVAQILGIANILLRDRDYVTMGRFVGLLNDQVVQQIAAAIEQESDLLEIAFHIEPRERVDHLVHILPPERINKALLIVCDPAKRQVWPKLLALMSNIGYDLKRQLGDLAVLQGDHVIEAIIQAAQEDDLWEDMLPVVTCLSPDVQRHVANLPALRRPEVMLRIVLAAESCALWTDMLTIAAYMNNAARDAVAHAISQVDGRILNHIAYATLLRSQWMVTLDIVRRLPRDQQMACYQILNHYTYALDVETTIYIHQLLVEFGIMESDLT